MNISIWDIFKYLYKWKIVIAGVVLISFLLAVFYVNGKQTYNSQIVLKFNDSCISEGKLPDGSAFDAYGIVSPNVLTQVIEDLSLKKTVDSIRSRVTVTPIIPESEKEIQESKAKDGEKYEYYPNTFSITYMGRSGESTNDVRDILDSIIQNYLEFYTEKYLQLASINDVAYDEDVGNYDYLEIAEIISDNLDETTSSLESYHSNDNTFRSATTGMSFADLSKEYNHLKEFIVPKLFSDIYRGQISKDKPRLIEKYIQKKEQHLLDENNYTDQANLARNRMDNFAYANEEVPNAYNTTTDSNDDNLAIIDNIYDTYNRLDSTTTYDKLMESYVEKSVAANNSALQAQHCEDVVAKFQVPIEEGLDIDALTKEVNELLTSAKDKMLELNKTANLTIADYNAYTATKHLSPLTGVQYYSTVSLALYALIAVIIGLALSVLLAVTVEIMRALKVHDKGDGEEEDLSEPGSKDSKTDTEMA